MDRADLRALGRKLRQTRRRLGLRLRDLSHMLGIPAAWLGVLETNRWRGRGPRDPDRLEAVREWIAQHSEGGAR